MNIQELKNKNIFRKGVDKLSPIYYNTPCVQRQQAVH